MALLNDVKFLDAPLRDRIHARERRIVDAFAGALERGWPKRMRAETRKPLTMALLGMINFTFAWLRPDGPMTHDQYAELVIELWERGLEGPGAAARPQPAFTDRRMESLR